MITDIESDAIIITVNLGAAISFTTYTDKTFKFSPTKAGSFEIIITLRDNNQLDPKS